MEGGKLLDTDITSLKAASEEELTRRGKASQINTYTNPVVGGKVYEEHIDKLFLDIDSIVSAQGYTHSAKIKNGDLTNLIAYLKSLQLQNIK